jgi:hypothetical protein
MSVNNDNNKKFDIAEFNKQFSNYTEGQKIINKTVAEERLDILNKENVVRIKIQEQSIIDILIGVKTSLFECLDDLLQHKFSLETFTKNNRLFYLGIAIIFLCLFLYLCDALLDDPENNTDSSNDGKIVKIYNLYKEKDSK